MWGDFAFENSPPGDFCGGFSPHPFFIGEHFYVHNSIAHVTVSINTSYTCLGGDCMLAFFSVHLKQLRVPSLMFYTVFICSAVFRPTAKSASRRIVRPSTPYSLPMRPEVPSLLSFRDFTEWTFCPVCSTVYRFAPVPPCRCFSASYCLPRR